MLSCNNDGSSVLSSNSGSLFLMLLTMSVIQQNAPKTEGSPELDIFGFFSIMSLFYSLSLDVICDPKVGSNF